MEIPPPKGGRFPSFLIWRLPLLARLFQLTCLQAIFAKIKIKMTKRKKNILKNCDFCLGYIVWYRVFHNTGHPEIWLSARPFINMNWTPENFPSASFHKGPGTWPIIRVSSVVKRPVQKNWGKIRRQFQSSWGWIASSFVFYSQAIPPPSSHLSFSRFTSDVQMYALLFLTDLLIQAAARVMSLQLVVWCEGQVAALANMHLRHISENKVFF